MCGIFGFYLKRQLINKDIEDGIKCLNTIDYRGPDYTGHWFNKEEGIFIGHNRLSIIDISEKSNQPFINHETVLAFNGEIYNYKELKELKLNDIKFETNSDTEVLSHFLNKYNCKFLNHIDGMFAFCFYKNKNLTIANDIFSEKTIYYVKNNEGVYFSSESGPLINLLNLKLSRNEEIKKQFMSLGYIIPPNTGFENLYITKQANLLNIKNGEIVNNTNYYSFPKLNLYKGKIRSLTNYDEKKIKNAIIESIESRMQSDVGMGLFLSSGNDSSLIASIMKLELNISPLALTLDYDKGLEHNESLDAKKITEFLGIEHIIEKDDTYIENKSNLTETIDLYKDLNDNISGLLIKNLSKLAKKYFKVAISGNGGDEMFYGYGKHDFFFKYEKVFSSKILNGLLRKLRTSSFLPNKLGIASSLSKYDNYNKILALNNFPFYFNNKSKEDFFIFENPINKNQNIFEDFRDFNLTYNLPNTIIQSNDKGSMRHSIELRSPFLTKKLLETVSEFDYRSFMHTGRNGILKKLLADYLPKNLITKDKRGFIHSLDNNITNENLEKYNLLSYRKSINQSTNWKKLVIRKMIYNEMMGTY